MRMLNCWWLPALALLLLISGCRRSELVNATGTVTYKGQPVPSTLVAFYPADDSKRSSHGLTDDNGNFTLSNSSSESGVFLGRHTVVLKYHPSADEDMHKVPPKASKELREVIAKYSNPKTSTLKYEVTSSGQHIEVKLGE
jgi:hypothetical protein